MTRESAASDPEKPLHLVFGASGYVGSNLVPFLQKEGVRVRAAARNIDILRAREWHSVELAQADALDAVTLTSALSGVDVAFYLVHSMAAGRDFSKLDLIAGKRLCREEQYKSCTSIRYILN